MHFIKHTKTFSQPEPRNGNERVDKNAMYVLYIRKDEAKRAAYLRTRTNEDPNPRNRFEKLSIVGIRTKET